ncbi:DNA cytosine methyltransferase [Paenibacillus alvei]
MKPIAIDLFCGAGGMSEGILQAGFHIVFSSDRSAHVRETYENRHRQLGLIQGENTHFELADIRDLTGEKVFSCIKNLNIFKGKPLPEIDAIFGGPPCQGFSIAGKRDKKDPRNMLFKEYIRIISEVKPKYVVMENVDGFMSMEMNDGFIGVSGIEYPNHVKAADVIQEELEICGYNVLKPRLLNASDYGVPQRRVRAIFIASRNDVCPASYPKPSTKEIEDKVTVSEAIADLINDVEPSSYAQSLRKGRTPHFETGEPISNYDKILNNVISKHNEVVKERFSLFGQGESLNHIISRIALTGLDLNDYPNLLLECVFNANKEKNVINFKDIMDRLKPDFYLDKKEKEKKLNSLYKKIITLWECNEIDKEALKTSKEFGLSLDEFKMIYSECKKVWNKEVTEEYILDMFKNDPNVSENGFLMEALLTKKNTRSRLDSNKVAPTMLTLPDDFIHPFLNRILNVREMARIQSFDDSFEFLGKRTTGGQRRKDEVPQFTQVGNAVPPLLAKAVALKIKEVLSIEQAHPVS